MRLRVLLEPHHGASYDQILALARATEESGFDAFFRSDHYQGIDPDDARYRPTDSWTTLAGLAVQTERVRLGTLMTASTYRRPGPLAITVATVDAMSGGRAELGIGAAWIEQEHRYLGIPFPPLGERFERLEEQLQIVTGLWDATGPYSFAGEHYSLKDSPALPKPVQRPHPPVIVGGFGAKRTPRLAATYADEFNLPFGSVEATGEQFDRVRAAAQETGRSLRYSAAQVVCVGRDDAEVTRRAAAIGREAQELRANGLAGSPAEVVEKIGRFAEVGVTRLYLQVLDLSDLDHLDLIASEVAAQL